MSMPDEVLRAQTRNRKLPLSSLSQVAEPQKKRAKLDAQALEKYAENGDPDL